MSIKRNTTLNIVGAAAPIAVTLFTVPIYLKIVGHERYGALVIVWAILGYFGVFDLGLGRATANRMSTLNQGPAQSREQLVWTAALLNSGFGLAGAVVLFIIGGWLGRFLSVPPALHDELSRALFWVALVVPLSTIPGVFAGALQGRERFVQLNITTSLDSVLFQLAPLAAAVRYGPNVANLVLAVVLARVAITVVYFAFCVGCIPLRRVPSIDSSLMRPLLRYGSWVTVTGIVAPFLSTMDRVMLGAIAGTRAVTYYAIPFNLVSRVLVLPTAFSGALLPRMSRQTDRERDQLTEQALSALLVVVSPLIMIALLLLDPFLHWWLTADVAGPAARTGEIICLGLWTNSLAYIAQVRLQAVGRPDVISKLLLLEMVPYLLLFFLAVRAWGPPGAALAWTIRATVDAALIFRAIHISRQAVRTIGAAGIQLTLGAAVTFTLSRYDPTRWILGLLLLLSMTRWAWMNAPSSIQTVTRKHLAWT